MPEVVSMGGCHGRALGFHQGPYAGWGFWEGPVGEGEPHLLLAKGDSRPTRAGLDFVTISFYFRYCRWKSVRNELRN